jgi:hypothetical protein
MSLLISGDLRLAKGQPVPNDPNFAFNSLLLHGDGTNGSTTITDSSLRPKTVTAFGNAQISTAQSKFGGSSIAFDGTGDYITAAPNPEFSFGTAAFTIEMWIRANAFSDVNVWFDTRLGGASSLGIVIFTNSSGQIVVYSGATAFITSTGVSTNQWYHIAVARESNTLRLFIDGINSGSATIANNFSDQNFFSGKTNEAASNFVNGYIDDLRITKGVARYTANFTPPTAPFPDF